MARPSQRDSFTRFSGVIRFFYKFVHLPVRYVLNIFFSFTLYPACIRVGRGTLVLRHSTIHFPPNYGGILRGVTKLNAELFLALVRSGKNKICNISKLRNENIKYLISSSKNRTHSRSRLQSHHEYLFFI